MVGGEALHQAHLRGDVSQGGARCDDDRVTRLWRICALAIVLFAAGPTLHASATTPPTIPPVVSNDLLPEKNDINNCIGTVEQANCGSKARADGHTYLVFLALTVGMTFIGWRIARSVKARDQAHQATR